MPKPGKAKSGKILSLGAAVSLPDVPGKCRYLGGYVQDGETVCYFGDEYVCRAPNLVSTGKSC